MSDTFSNPMPLGLNAQEATERFDALQRGLLDQWKLIQSMNQLEQTMVVVPSVSVEIDVPGALLQAYEERMLFLLFLMRKPLARIIYCTSQPILPNVIDYYLGLLPGVIPSHARARLTTIAVHDGSSRPLSQKILERPKLINQIRQLIENPKTTHMVPFNTTMLERDLALRLGIPMYGADPRFLDLGAKSGCRALFAEEGVAHPLGVEELFGEDDLVQAISTIRQQKPELEQVITKLNEGVSGMGNALVTLTDVAAPGVPGEGDEIRERLRAMRFDHDGGTYDDFIAKLARQGGVVEERLVGTEIRSPSVQARITPLGKVELLSTHDQLLGGSGGQSFMGCLFPADPSYSTKICHDTRVIGERLCKEGVLGRFALDFVVIRDASGTWLTYAIEINLRKGGTTAPYLTLEFLTDGSYDAESGVFSTRHGQEKHYVANDHITGDAFRGITPDDLFDIVVRHGLHFDHTTQTGVVFHMLSAITEHGCFGLTAVANTRAEAEDLHDRTVAVLGFESDRANTDPGLPE